MRISTPITKAKLKTHFAYGSWKYLVIVLGSIFLWNIAYTTTAYRSPENKRVDVYLQSATATEEKVNAFFKEVWDAHIPDMETVSAVILTSTADDYYGSMQLSVYMMAGEGDLYILTTSDFKTYAAQEIFLDLEPFIASGQLDVTGIDLSAGYVAVNDSEGVPTGERKLFGIPLYTLYGYMDGMLLDNRNVVIAMTAYNGNEENVLKFLNGLIQAGRGDMPEWMTQ